LKEKNNQQNNFFSEKRKNQTLIDQEKTRKKTSKISAHQKIEKFNSSAQFSLEPAKVMGSNRAEP